MSSATPIKKGRKTMVLVDSLGQSRDMELAWRGYEDSIRLLMRPMQAQEFLRNSRVTFEQRLKQLEYIRLHCRGHRGLSAHQ
jgi:hypothetical protein